MRESLRVTLVLSGLLAAHPALAQVTRVANTTLKMPTNPQKTYAVAAAFPSLTFTAPIAFATPPGETQRLFVVERAGRIKVIPSLDSPSTATFLDISSRVVT